MIGMWAELETIFAKDGVSIDKAASYFVGDAAGRIYSTASGKNGKNGKEKKDFASSDRKWAINVGVPFQTPEVRGLLSSLSVHFELLDTTTRTSMFQVCPSVHISRTS